MLIGEIAQSGEAKVLVQSDGEPAILKLVQVSSAAARISHGTTVLTEQTPKGESKANGLAEGAVRDCKAKVRTRPRNSLEWPYNTSTGHCLFCASMPERQSREPGSMSTLHMSLSVTMLYQKTPIALMLGEIRLGFSKVINGFPIREVKINEVLKRTIR